MQHSTSQSHTLQQFNAVNWSLASYMFNQTTVNHNTSPTLLRDLYEHRSEEARRRIRKLCNCSPGEFGALAQATSSTARPTASSVRHREALNLAPLLPQKLRSGPRYGIRNSKFNLLSVISRGITIFYCYLTNNARPKSR